MNAIGNIEKSRVNANTLASYCRSTTVGRLAVHAGAQHACAQPHELQVPQCEQVT